MRILFIDNYDSFTYNLLQIFRGLGADVILFQNDEITPNQALADVNPSHLVLAPGPGRPEDAGNLLAIAEYFSKKIPILGVCLGHQALATIFGGRVVYAKELKHGKADWIQHSQSGIFSGISTPMQVGRYHSLAVEVKKNFKITAQTDDGEIMGIEHVTLPIFGIQFHPESILTPQGPILISNFLRGTR